LLRYLGGLHLFRLHLNIGLLFASRDTLGGSLSGLGGLAWFRGLCWFRGLSWFRWCRDILLDGDLLLLGPLFLEVGGFEHGDLVDVVADAQDERELFVVLQLALLDRVGCHLAGETL
jgi:hypothetical protein